MDSLTSDQQRALAQLQDLTNGGDDDVAVSVLDSVDWDVQRAAEFIFGTASTSTSVPTPHTASSPPVHRPMETFQVDDSEQGIPPNRGAEPHWQRPPQSSWFLATRPGSILSVLAFPLHILSSIFRFIFGVLRIPIPQFRFTGLSFYRPLRPRRPTSRGAPDRWIRELEEETGAVCIGRAKVPRGATTSATDAGPSTLTMRPPNANGLVDEGRKLLPDFTLGTYEETLRTCQREAKIGCVILVSEEHDDVTEFKRSTLTDPTFVKVLYDNNIIVWGGDVRDQEPWSAAEKLQATTYPFVAFIALQPRRSPASSTTASRFSQTTPPTLTVLSRHQGRSVPSSTAPTSAHTLIDHLERQLLPRVTPFLERIKATQRERERDRVLREEQDRAFQDSARRDKERIEGKMREEREAKEKKRKAEDEKKKEEEMRIREETQRERMKEKRMEWRRWARKALVLPDVNGSKDVLRIAIRLPGDGRVIRRFALTATLTALYAYVDAQLIPPHFLPEDDPATPPEGNASGEASIEQQILLSNEPAEEWWGFKLVLAYPRREIGWNAETRLCDIDSLKGGGQVVVEMLDDRRVPADQAAEQEDDGYDTEDSNS